MFKLLWLLRIIKFLIKYLEKLQPDDLQLIPENWPSKFEERIKNSVGNYGLLNDLRNV